MTTYLSHFVFYGTEDVTLPFCSPAHSRLYSEDYKCPSLVRRADDRYEFDEECSYCGVTIFGRELRSQLICSLDGLFVMDAATCAVDRVERRVATDDTKALLSRRLMDRYTPGIKEEVKFS